MKPDSRTLSAERAMHRRGFLQLGAALGGVLLGRPAFAGTPPWPWSARLAGELAYGRPGGIPGLTRAGVVIGPGRTTTEQGEEFGVSILDLDRPEPLLREIALDYLGHGVVVDPTNPARAVVFEKRGPGASELDLAAGRLVRPIVSPPEREFYGHGAFLPDGSLLYATESMITDDYRGVVVVRDGRTLAELGEFPTYGDSPHDCVLRDGGKTLVITNGGSQRPGGSPGCVTYVDVASEKLIEKLELDDPSFNAGHLALSEAGDLAVVSSVRDWMPRESLGAATFRPVGGSFRTVSEPAATRRRMIGESLSLTIHEATGIVGITNPRGHLVTFWHLKRGELMGELHLSVPRGIAQTLDRSHFVVSYGEQTSVLLVSPDTLEPVPGTRVPETKMGGSHILVHDLPR